MQLNKVTSENILELVERMVVVDKHNQSNQFDFGDKKKKPIIMLNNVWN